MQGGRVTATPPFPLPLPYFSSFQTQNNNMLSVTKTDKDIKYRAAAEYEPAHDDEIGLAVGDIVFVLHAYDDGKPYSHFSIQTTFCIQSKKKYLFFFPRLVPR